MDTQSSKIISRKTARSMTTTARRAAMSPIALQVQMNAGGYDQSKAMAQYKAQRRAEKVSPNRVSINLSNSSNRSTAYGISGTGVPFKTTYNVSREIFRGMPKWMTVQTLLRLRPFLMKLHPWLRYVDLAMNLYDLAYAMGLTDQDFNEFAKGFINTGKFYNTVAACGGGGGPVTNVESWPTCAGDFVVNDASKTSFQAYDTRIYFWGPKVRSFNATRSYYKPGYEVRRDTAAAPASFRLQRAFAAVGPSFSPSPGVTMPAAAPKTAPQVKGPSQPPPPTFSPPIHKAVPPGPRVKERKGRASPAVAAALAAAHGFTEGVDVVDALFSALPKNIQRETKRSGRTKRGAKIGEGKPFLTPLDKAAAVYRNLGKMDLNAAMMNLLKNHLEDAVIGRMNAGADAFSRRNLGGARFVNGG